MREMSGLNEELLVSEEGFCSVEPLYSIISSLPAFRNRRYFQLMHISLFISLFVTQHIKQLYYYNWLHSATCFRRYPAIIRSTMNSVN